MANDPAARGRPRRHPAAPAGAPVADPTRGTRVAVALPLAALALTVGWVAFDGAGSLRGTALAVAGLTLVAGLAERISIQLGPRSWYTPTTPVIVLAGLVAGPLGGVVVAAVSQTATDAVWRRRAAGAGLGAVQGFTAGLFGLESVGSPGRAVMLSVLGMSVAVTVNSAGRWLILTDRGATPRLAMWRRGAFVDVIESLIAVPLLACLLLVVPQSEELAIAVLAALLTALAIAQRMRETTIAALETEQANARRDILTGAPNRRAFEELIAQQHARVVRGDAPAGLFLVDVDRFKAINDRYGHHTGDLVLVEVVKRLHEGLRATDVVARWGGEEITVLAPSIRSRRGLEEFADRIRRLIGDVPLAVDRVTIPLTVSVGGTLLDGSRSPTEAMTQADTAMYEAKRTRDAVVVLLPPRLTLRLGAAS